MEKVFTDLVIQRIFTEYPLCASHGISVNKTGQEAYLRRVWVLPTLSPLCFSFVLHWSVSILWVFSFRCFSRKRELWLTARFSFSQRPHQEHPRSPPTEPVPGKTMGAFVYCNLQTRQGKRKRRSFVFSVAEGAILMVAKKTEEMWHHVAGVPFSSPSALGRGSSDCSRTGSLGKHHHGSSSLPYVTTDFSDR